MPTPTPPPHRRDPLAPRWPAPDVPEPTPWETALAVVARLGTAVTLVALLVVTGGLLAVLDAGPVPAGVSTEGR